MVLQPETTLNFAVEQLSYILDRAGKDTRGKDTIIAIDLSNPLEVFSSLKKMTLKRKKVSNFVLILNIIVILENEKTYLFRNSKNI
jgi:hypothetical protein